MSLYSSNGQILDKSLNYSSNDCDSNLDVFPVVTMPRMHAPSTFSFDSSNEALPLNDITDIVTDPPRTDDSQDAVLDDEHLIPSECGCCGCTCMV